MNRADILKNTLTALFRSGADEDHTADEMQELLDGIDFSALLQAAFSLRERVYEYRVDGSWDKSFSYYGPELLPGSAVLLYTDIRDIFSDAALHEQAYELWMTQSASLVVLSRVRTVVGSGGCVMEYRTVKGTNWKDAGMSIDFLDLADDLDALCAAVAAHELPRYEV